MIRRGYSSHGAAIHRAAEKGKSYNQRVLRKSKYLLRRSISILHWGIASFPKIVECNICGCQAKYFDSDSWHRGTICWSCRSDVRHRLLIAALLRLDMLSFEHLVRAKNLLHFAPEPAIGSFLKQQANCYITADINPKKVDIQLDIANMSTVNSNEFDLVIACDVLEHVGNDKQAIKELYRILRTGGYAILTVPQLDNIEETYEDSTITTSEGRKRAFGQSDHLRIYGADFSRLLKTVGFQVTVIDAKSFTVETVKKNVLSPPVLSSNPLATNYRKIFFAKKV
jgi:predicted SAM-dependent methyltransferase